VLIAFAPMSRVWLLLLAIVVPLQMSWAAVPFCDDAAAARPLETAALAVVQDHAHAADVSQSEAEVSGECCGAAHGCHGLHNLMATGTTALVIANSSHVVPSRDDPTSQRQFAHRHERPQWSAA